MNKIKNTANLRCGGRVEAEWRPSGRLELHCIYVNDTRHDEYKTWFRDGRVCSHWFYVNGEHVSFSELPYPETPEDRLYFTLKYNIPLLPQ